MNSDTCEKLSVFCLGLFGLGTATAISMGTIMLGAGGVALTVPSLLRSLRGDHSLDGLVTTARKTVEREWRTWARSAGDVPEAKATSAADALEQVLDLLAPQPQAIMALGRNSRAVSEAIAADAFARVPGAFATPAGLTSEALDPDQAIFNTTFLRAMVEGTLSHLDGSPEVEAWLTPWFQRQVFSRLDDLEALIEGLPGRFAASLDRGGRDALVAELTRIRTQFGATNALIADFLRRMIGTEVPPEQFAATLYSNMERWRDAGERLGALDRSANLAPELAGLKDRAKAAFDGNDIDEAWRQIEDIDRREQANFDRIDAHLREVANERDARRADLIATKEARRDIALARVRPKEAAESIAALVDLQTADNAERFADLRKALDEWYERGSDKGLTLDLLVAIELGRLAVARAADEEQAGAAHNDLGLALWILGERESGPARLDEAAASFRAAIKHRGRDRAPLDWALAHNNLGNVLQALGRRESGAGRLEEAVAAYRAALEEYARDRVPADWAMTQNNLGNALQSLGGRESGTAHLEEAVTAYRAALEEYTRERMPHYWAVTQNNLGNALAMLGDRESGTARLEDAVAAYRAALEERTRDRVPLSWAGTQNNLGNALKTIGLRESGTMRLEEAVAAHRAALEEYTRDRVPFLWAQARLNLGIDLVALFDRTGETHFVQEARAAGTGALQEFRLAGAEFFVKRAEALLADIEASGRSA